MSQLSIFDRPEEDDMFTPDGERRCRGCGRRLAWFGGRLRCTNGQCTGDR